MSSVVETITSLPKIFYSQSFYRRLILQDRGVGTGFILILALITLIGEGVMIYSPMRLITEQITTLAAKVPQVTIHSGKLSIDQPSPWIGTLDLPKDKDHEDTDREIPPKIVIDTSYKGDISALTGRMEKEKIAVFVTADKFLVQKHNSEIDIHDLSKSPDRTITHDDWIRYGQIGRIWFYPVVMLGLAIIDVIGGFISALIMAAVFLVLSLAIKVETQFSGMMRLSAATHIPGGIVAVFYTPLPLYAKLIVWIGYAVFGLYAARTASREQPI